jgi:hypothetical protein
MKICLMQEDIFIVPPNFLQDMKINTFLGAQEAAPDAPNTIAGKGCDVVYRFFLAIISLVHGAFMCVGACCLGCIACHISANVNQSTRNIRNIFNPFGFHRVPSQRTGMPIDMVPTATLVEV